MKYIFFFFLAFLFLGGTEAFSQAFPQTEGVNKEPRAEGRKKKKYNTLRKSRRQSTAYQRKKDALRAGQSAVASDFRTNEPAANPDKTRQSMEAAKFKGQQPFIGPNKEVTQAKMAKFKGNGVPVPNQGQKDANQLKISRYRGDYPSDLANRRQAYEIAATKQMRFKGPIKVLGPKAQRSIMETASLRQSGSLGPVRIPSPQTQRSSYEITSLKHSRSLGPVRVLSPDSRRSQYELTSLKTSQFKGEKIRIQKIKNAYPTIAYLKAKKKTSFEAKERYRKRMLKKINRNKKKQIPPSERKIDKENIPQYDTRENEIWAKPRNADGSERQVTYKKKFSLNPFKKKDPKSKPKSEPPPTDDPAEEKK